MYGSAYVAVRPAVTGPDSSWDLRSQHATDKYDTPPSHIILTNVVLASKLYKC